jgi:cytochrome b subunit of formate dehydrogenase
MRRFREHWGRLLLCRNARAQLALLICLLGTFGTGSIAAPAQPEPPTPNARCQSCHDDSGIKDKGGHSLNVDGEVFTASAHRKVACVECHKDAQDVRHPRQELGPVALTTCAGCHQAAVDGLKGSAHAAATASAPGIAPAPGGKSAATCVSCHGNLHAVPRGSDTNGPMSALNQVLTCGHCHQDMMKQYLGSRHAQALFSSGLVGAPSCTRCHGSGHDIQAAAVGTATISHQSVPQLCGTCHAGVLKEWKDSVHGLVLQDGDKKGPVCTTCHEAHAISAPQSAEMRQRFPGDCGSCHSALYKSYQDSFHGKAGTLGYTAVAMCSDCHTPHHNLKASDPRSSTNPTHLAATCGKCHQGEVNAAFLTFDPHADPTNAGGNQYLHWLWLFMTVLLLGVFGFFGLHDLLWLQRSIVGKLRGEFPAPKTHDGPYVRRFTSSQIWVHLTVVVSFLLLAATGLPLKFATASWAPTLMALVGGPHTAGILHRIGAVVTFGYFGVHLLGALYEMVVKHERGYLWGPRSMVPQPRDVRDFIDNVGYFLYLRKAPRFDRWTYWEKFDYLAVFWGVGMIGFTGLMLWFPGFFTRFLPGWTLNAAYLAHSDEALLATGFIFLFHYFHTHLRPETFPMDPVVFTGRLPLERFKEERPEEYERLVATNELEGLLAPAPTKAELVRAYTFGFAAVAIGVALAVGIFVALIGNLSR